MKRGHQEFQNILDLRQQSLLVRRQYNWKGQEEYCVEVKGLDGCVGHGDTYKEAKEDLIFAIKLWVKKEGRIELLRLNENEKPLLYIEPAMTDEEVNRINIIVKEWNE